jgi:hypothetical protein
VTRSPEEPSRYRARLGAFPDLVHVTVEVNVPADAGERPAA